MGLAIQVAVAALYSLAILGLFLYGMNAWVMVAIHVWRRRHARPSPPAPDVWPAVTVQLPIYNERYVARRLLEAVGALDYPADRFEIQILDDSTDETTAILTDAARVLTERGLNVVHIHRRERTGFTASSPRSSTPTSSPRATSSAPRSPTSPIPASPLSRPAGAISIATSRF